MSIVDWLTNNWIQIVAALAGIVIAARVIVKLTPTPADDSFLEKIVELLKHLGLVIKDDSEKKP